MSTIETFCGATSCGRPTTSGVLCNECQADLVKHVDSLPWDLEQLQTAATNQNRFTTGGGAKSNETPLMFNPYASTALASLVATVQIWQARMADHVGQPVRFTNPLRAAKWMGQHVDQTRTYINAGQLLDALTYAHDHVEHTINKPPQRQFLGDCATVDETGHTCPGRMYAFAEETEARCDTCGKTIDAATKREELIHELDDRKLTASEIAQLATYMGLTINREQVRKRVNQWSSRGRIIAADHVGSDPRFKFLEVRLLLEQDEGARQEVTVLSPVTPKIAVERRIG